MMDIILHPPLYYRVQGYRLVERLLFGGITHLALLGLHITNDLRITMIISVREAVIRQAVIIDLTIRVTTGIRMIRSHIIMRIITRIREVEMAGVAEAVTLFE